jgi:hypothetical protein
MKGRRLFAAAPSSSHSQTDGRLGWLLTFSDLVCLMLAFFVLLNAFSKQDTEKAGAVLQGLEKRFVSGAPVSSIGLLDEAVSSRDGSTILPSQFRQHIGTIVERDLPIEQVQELEQGRRFAVVVKRGDLFSLDGKLLVRRQAVIDRIADALRRHPDGVSYELEVRLASAQRPGLADEAGRLVEAGHLAASLVASGAPRPAVSVAIEQGDPEKLRLIFNIRVVDEAPVRLDQPGSAP